MMGLCGNFDSIQENDKWASDGITHEDVYEFASLWQVLPFCLVSYKTKIFFFQKNFMLWIKPRFFVLCYGKLSKKLADKFLFT